MLEVTAWQQEKDLLPAAAGSRKKIPGNQISTQPWTEAEGVIPEAKSYL